MSRLLRFLLIVLTIGGAFLVLAAVTSKLYRIPTSSMEPTLHCSRGEDNPGCLGDDADRIAVSKVLYKWRDPERRDIVAYEVPDRGAVRCGVAPDATFVHRIIALPGERVAIRNGVVFIDDRRLTESYVELPRRGGSIPETVVPSRRYFVLGDNRGASCDSRSLGFVDRDDIIGPRIATYWPLGRISFR